MAVKLSNVDRIAKLDATVTELTGAPKLLEEFEVSPNQGFTYGATGGAFSLRFVESDREDGQVLATMDVAITSTGYAGEYLPACNKVAIYAFVASGSVDAKVRIFPKGVQ